VPAGINPIRLRLDIDGNPTDAQPATLLKRTERCCVNLLTLRKPPRLCATFQRSGVR
jgi:hypothetical protein